MLFNIVRKKADQRQRGDNPTAFISNAVTFKSFLAFIGWTQRGVRLKRGSKKETDRMTLTMSILKTKALLIRPPQPAAPPGIIAHILYLHVAEMAHT